MMNANTYKKIPYYLVIAGIFLSLKFAFTSANNNNLTFLLKPTDKLVGLLTGSQSVYLADIGFYHDKLNIIIDKSCSGYNFWLLCFLVFTSLTIKHLDKPLQKMMTIPIVLVASYFLTIFVNTSRIFASILVQNHADKFLPVRPHFILHEAVGIITNLSFLVLTYYIFEKLLKNKLHNAKPV
jgi:exosortase K